MFKEFLESKMKASNVVKLLKDSKHWGDLGEYVSVKKGEIEILDTFFYNGDKALQNLKDEWTTGTYAKYFKEEYGISFEVTDSFQQIVADKKYKKLTGGSGGINGIYLKIKG